MLPRCSAAVAHVGWLVDDCPPIHCLLFTTMYCSERDLFVQLVVGILAGSQTTGCSFTTGAFGRSDGSIFSVTLACLASPLRFSCDSVCLLAGVEAESQGSAPSPSLQQVGRNRQVPRGNKPRHRHGSSSHPPASSFAPTIDEHGSGAKKIGQTPLMFPRRSTWRSGGGLR